MTAYALSPIDLIHDFIPVLGYLDDLLIVPVGIMLVIKLVPPDVMPECQNRAAKMQAAGAPQFRWMELVAIVLWIAVLAFVVVQVFSLARQ